jgi:large subunit ribosomal protein L20
MPRVKGATNALKNRKKTLKRAKGFRNGRSTKERQANEALAHAGNYAFAHRRQKKNDFRRLWTVRLNAAVRQHGLSYSKFIDALKKKNVTLDRKVLSEIAQDSPDVFEKIVDQVK